MEPGRKDDTKERSRSRSRSRQRRHDREAGQQDRKQSTRGSSPSGSSSESPDERSGRKHRHKSSSRSRSRSHSPSRRKHSRHRDDSSRSRKHDRHGRNEKKGSKSHRHHRRHRRSRSRSASPAAAASSSAGHAGVVDQHKFGARGIINQTHFFEKTKEFQVWLADVKGISPDAPVPKAELLEFFKDYAEDYNTCTLPGEKYYDLEKFEAESRRRAAGGGGGGLAESADAGTFNMLKEQDSRKRAQAEQAKAADIQRMAMYYANMDPGRKAAMKAQQELALKMQYEFKRGNIHDAERIRKQLEPDKK